MFAAIAPSLPAGKIVICESFLYSIPPETTTTDLITPFSRIGVNLQYFPFLTIKFGGELYPDPPLFTITSVMVPLTTTGVS